MKRNYLQHKVEFIGAETNINPSIITRDDALLTSEEVSTLIGKSKAWLARKRWEGGGIPYRKIGHHVRYQASTVMNWLNSQPEKTSTTDSR